MSQHDTESTLLNLLELLRQKVTQYIQLYRT